MEIRAGAAFLSMEGGSFFLLWESPGDQICSKDRQLVGVRPTYVGKGNLLPLKFIYG